MSKNAIILSIVLVVTFILTVSAAKIFDFKSDHKWVNINKSHLPAAVRDTLEKQRANKQSEYVTLLDSSFFKKVTFNIVNNYFIVGGYDYYDIGYKGNKLVAKKEFIDPPFVIYQNKMYATLGHRFSADSSKPLVFLYTILKKAQ